MSDPVDNRENLSRLLRVKEALGLGGSDGQPGRARDRGDLLRRIADAEPEEQPAGVPRVCINCGYRQEGLDVERCPECGLPLAARYSDPTPWNTSRRTPLHWWATACKVWTWDRRIRVRTALIPTTKAGRRFALWSIVAAALPAATGLAVVNLVTVGPGSLVALHFILQVVVGTLVIGLFLAATQVALTLAVRGSWRRRFRFVPVSLHYATAFWPQIAVLLLALAVFHATWPRRETPVAAVIVVLAGVIVWGMWLWASALEGQRVRRAGLRIAGVIAAATLIGGVLLYVIPGAVRLGMTQSLRAFDSGLTRLQMFGTIQANPLRQGPRTFAVLVDAIPSDDEDLVLDGIANLGAGPDTRVVMRGAQTRLTAVRAALAAIRKELRQDDRLILYLNGHGAEHGAGSIRVADGEITSQTVRDLLADLPTPDTLVVVDSCFGGKFVRALRDQDAVVIAATDDENVAFKSGLSRFWEALGTAESDQDEDGRITVSEALWGVYRKMLEDGESRRQSGLARVPTETPLAELLAESGYATPQLDVFGSANEDVFAVDVASLTVPGESDR